MKVWMVSVTTLLAAIVCTGCWDSTEIDRLAIVTMTGVDLGPDKKSVVGSMQIARASELGTTGGGAPSTSTGSPEAFIVETTTGENAIASLEKARSRLSRKLFMGHRRVVVLGEEYARNGIQPLLDEIIRNSRSRLRTYIVVAYHNEATAVLKTPYPLNRLPSDAIVEMEQSGSVLHIDARQFMKQLTEHGDPVATGVELVGATQTDTSQSTTSFALANIAVFKKDKLVGWLEGPSAHGFLWLHGDLRREDSTVALPNQTGSVSARLANANVRRSVRIVNGVPELQVHIKTQYDINQNATNVDFKDPRNLQLLRDALAKDMTKQMKDTMTDLQQTYQVDALNFADIVSKRYPTTWKKLEPRWREVYSKAPVQYMVDIRVRNSGLISSSVYKETSNLSSDGSSNSTDTSNVSSG